MKSFTSGCHDTRGLLSRYEAQGRNGYTAIDHYVIDQDHAAKGWPGSCQRMIDAYRTKKEGNATAAHLNSAYAQGWLDAVGTWPNFPTAETRGDVALYRLDCPQHQTQTSDGLATARLSADNHKCPLCFRIAEIIETRERLREQAAGLVDALQEYDTARGRLRND